MSTHKLSSMILAGAVVLAANGAMADTFGTGANQFTMDFVTVGNAGNTADTEVMTHSGGTAGAVGYNYRIGTYEVTADQWAAVLAAAPTVGNAGLYSGSQPTGGTSWYEAAKFCNWLTTGNVDSGVYSTSTWAPMDHQTAGTTYGTAYFIPTENEWYKAAYYDPAKDDGAGGYWNYPTRSDTAPTATTVENQLNVAPGSANYANAVGGPTDVGAYNLKPSTSAYGTFDQGGNVWEWNENVIFWDGGRVFRGGSFDHHERNLLASDQSGGDATIDSNRGVIGLGFRVASVPEPGSIILIVSGAIAALILWRRRK